MEDGRRKPKSEETLKKMSEAKKGRTYSVAHCANISKGKSKQVICFDLFGKFVKFYNSTLETAVDGFSPAQVSMVCTNKRPSHKKHVFRYLQFEEPLPPINKIDLYINIMSNGEILLSEDEKIAEAECYFRAKSHIYDKIKAFYEDCSKITIKMVDKNIQISEETDLFSNIDD